MTKASDTQVGGDHYKAMGDFQPWDVLAHWLTPEEYRGYQKGVAIAYLARERSKGGDQDIRKAVHHLQRLVEELDAQALPIIYQPTDGAKCCGQPNTCENPCFHGGQPKPDADGWIEWHGGECPAPEGTVLLVKFRDGWTSSASYPCSKPERLRWDHRSDASRDGDIIAYRIINPTT